MTYDSFVRDRLPAPDQLPEFMLLDYRPRLNAAVELLKGGAPGDLAIVNALGRWTYRVITPGTYEWRSPHGYTYRTDRSGTTDTGPDPGR